MGRIHLPAVALVAAFSITSSASAQTDDGSAIEDTSAPADETADQGTDSSPDSDADAPSDVDSVARPDSDSDAPPDSEAESDAGSDTASGANAASPPAARPGEPDWMTPELREALDDPEMSAEIRDYFHRPTLEWKESWSRFGWADGGVMLGLGAVGLIAQLFTESSEPRWTGGILFDDDIRNAMVLSTYDERESVATVSDDLLALLMLYPYLVDGVIVTLLIHEAPDVAAEMMLVDTLAFAVTWAVVNVTKKAVARERPFVQECASQPGYANGCNPNDHGRNSSFISGHAAFSFTAAGLMCAHHINLPIHGDPVADYAVCGGGLLAATTVAAMRIMADRHWFSDVFAGSAVGLLAGWLMPTLLRYQDWNPLPQTEHVKMVPVPQMGPNQIGLGVTGIF